VLGRILHNRGLTQPAQAQAFLAHHYLLSRDPFQLADMDAPPTASSRPARGIAVYGDFDADGITATVLLTETLRAMAETPADRALHPPTASMKGTA
jgi:single-stranded-DNA-specific exonuclease